MWFPGTRAFIVTLTLLSAPACGSDVNPETHPSEPRMNTQQTRDCVLAYSSGHVTKPESYNYRTFLPERDGLYGTEIFGPVSWTSGNNRIAEDTRADRWGHIELAAPVPHPQAREVSLTVVPVHPPPIDGCER